MRKILGYISEEDHERLVHSYALTVLAVSGHPEMGVDEAIEE